jgi:sugar lactone lactonase YvrE
MEGTVVADGLCYPECPRWHDGALWLSDQYDGTVWRVDPFRRRSERRDGPIAAGTVAARVETPSGLGWLGDDLLVVSMHDRAVLRVGPDGDATTFAELGAFHRGPANDMVVVPPDLVLVGNIGFDFYAGEPLAETVLLRVGPDGGVTVAAEGLVCPNGMAVTPGRDRLHVAESLAGRITTFALGPGGDLGDRQVFADLPGRRPDGICLDAEGAVWAACARSPDVLRIAPGGEVLGVVRSENQVYACVLGGPDRRTLFVCTAPSDVPDEAVARRGGRVEAWTVDVPGAGWP